VQDFILGLVSNVLIVGYELFRKVDHPHGMLTSQCGLLSISIETHFQHSHGACCLVISARESVEDHSIPSAHLRRRSDLAR
jgi:hypothetical protein